MKRLVVLVMLASAMSSQAFGAVIDKFKCQMTIKDNVTGVDSKQEVTLDSLRKLLEKPDGWSTDVRLYTGGTFIEGALSGQNGRNLATFQASYHVAEKYDAHGQLMAAKVSPHNWMSGTYCLKGKPCLGQGQSVRIPIDDPFSNPSAPGWKDLQIHGGLAVLNAEDFQELSQNFRDDQGRYDFDVAGGCQFKASIMPAPGT